MGTGAGIIKGMSRRLNVKRDDVEIQLDFKDISVPVWKGSAVKHLELSMSVILFRTSSNR